MSTKIMNANPKVHSWVNTTSRIVNAFVWWNTIVMALAPIKMDQTVIIVRPARTCWAKRQIPVKTWLSFGKFLISLPGTTPVSTVHGIDCVRETWKDREFRNWSGKVREFGLKQPFIVSNAHHFQAQHDVTHRHDLVLALLRWPITRKHLQKWNYKKMAAPTFCHRTGNKNPDRWYRNVSMDWNT